MTYPTVVAAVLVHDAVDSLRRVIEQIEQQTLPVARIVVFDNASRVDVAAALAGRGITVLRSDENIGVGAGHSQAWEEALRDESVTHVWVLEHDTYPAPDCLARLLEAAPAGTDAVCVPRLERNEEEAAAREAAVVQAPPTPTPRLTFNGILVPRAVIERVGSPAEHFFVGGEDWDFARRLRSHGVEILKVFSALVTHPTKGNRRVGIRPSVSRAYYSTRNWMHLELVQHGLAYAPWCVAWCAASLPKIALTEDRKLERIASRVAATYDAVAGRMGRRDYWFLRR